jgi:hypothetical protein
LIERLPRQNEIDTVDSVNPYAAPADAAVISGPTGSGSEAEAIRRQYLKHEASIKSIGTLYMIGAVLLIPLSLFLIGGSVVAMRTRQELGPLESGFGIVFGVVCAVLGAVQLALAIGLRRLRTWARWGATAFATIGLLGFPVGTLINIFILYLLLSKKGAYVFSAPYQQVIAATPHVKYRTSRVVIVVLLLLLAVIIAAIVIATVSKADLP